MQRESFGSRLGFLLVSAGCAIGIGNVWRFPYITGKNGGGYFVLFYLVCLLLLGVPVMTMELAEDCGIRLLCVDGAAAKRLQDSCSSYSVCTIPAGTYPGQEEEVQTVGVKAVLLASAALPEKQVEQLTKLLFDGRENLSTQLGIRLDTEAEATEGVGIPFHKGAAAYYKTADITVAS